MILTNNFGELKGSTTCSTPNFHHLKFVRRPDPVQRSQGDLRAPINRNRVNTHQEVPADRSGEGGAGAGGESLSCIAVVCQVVGRVHTRLLLAFIVWPLATHLFADGVGRGGGIITAKHGRTPSDHRPGVLRLTIAAHLRMTKKI